MKPKPKELRSPRTFISVIDDRGRILSTTNGVTFVLRCKSETLPPYAVEVLGTNRAKCFDILIAWDGNQLTGYEGIADIPIELSLWLKSLGFNTDAVEHLSAPRRN